MMRGEEIPLGLFKAAIDEAIVEGRRRQDENDAKGRTKTFEAHPENRYISHIDGALCERALWECVHPGEAWITPVLGAPDVPPYDCCGRKVTEKMPDPHSLDLTIRPGNKDDRPLVLVVMINPAEFLIAGYVDRLGDWKKKEYYWDNAPYPPTWLVRRYLLKKFPQGGKSHA